MAKLVALLRHPTVLHEELLDALPHIRAAVEKFVTSPAADAV